MSKMQKFSEVVEGAEEVVEIFTTGLGMIITRITPLVAPLASGLTVLFAIYDGGSRILATMGIPNPRNVALWFGIVLMFILEGINFGAIFQRDRAEKLRDKFTKELGGIDYSGLVNYAFVFTLLIVFVLETLPGVASWWQGQIATSDLVFKAGLLILPWFSRIGAKIFSLAMILDGLEGVQQKRRDRHIQAKREEEELTIELAEKRRESELKLAQQEAEGKQRLELDRAKAEAKLSKSVSSTKPKSVSRDVSQSVPYTGSTDDDTLSDTLDGTKKRRDTVRNILLDQGWPGATKLSRMVGAGRRTIYRDLEALEGEGFLRVVKDTEGKIVDVIIGSAIAIELPAPALHMNGNGVAH